MKKLLTLATMMLIVLTSILAQNVTTVTFTGERQDKSYQKLDSVLVTNLTQDWSEVVYYPDTLILLSNVSITDYESRNGKVHLYQNIPNPFHGVTNFNLTLASKEKVDLVIYDISGRKVTEYHNTLPSGEHQFRTSMDIPQTYLLSAVTKSGTTSIKMINLSNTGEQARIELISSLPLAGDFVKKESIHGFKVGDEMQYVGYATQITDVQEATITKAQTESETITFTFPNEVYTRKITVTTGDASNIEYTTVTLSGTYEVKNTEVKEAGFEYKKSTDASFQKFLSLGAASPFTTTIKTLDDGTDYTYKAYVKTTEDSVVYGEEKTFSTKKIIAPKVVTDKATNIAKSSATLNGSYEQGSEKLIATGFELKAEKDEKFETIYSTANCTTPFQYDCNEKLEPGTNYVYRAFVYTTSGKQFLGNEVTFTTVIATPELPVVSTLPAETKAYNETKALLSGKIVSEGYCTMKEKGFFLGTSESPQKDGRKITVDLDGKFEFETEMLNVNTTYYFQAFATNEQGTAFGDVLSFKSRPSNTLPNIDISKVEPFATSAKVSCDVTIKTTLPQVAEEILEAGVCYSEKESPTMADTKVVANTTDIEPFTVSITGLKANTTYYVRGYLFTYAGTIYSNPEKMITTTLTKPEIQTVSVEKVQSTNATVLSKLTINGGSENLTIGVRIFNKELKFDSIYVYNGTLSADNTFETKILKLQKGTKYSAQAYAKNEIGEVFGETLNFITSVAFNCGEMMEDFDGNSYNTVQIGSNCWMADNLRVKHMPDGRELIEWKPGLRLERYYTEIINEFLPGGSNVYYTWATAADNNLGNKEPNRHIQGICPDGWHLPSYLEFSDLIHTIDNDASISLDKWSSSTGCGFAGTSMNSTNALAIKLSAKEGLWKSYTSQGAGISGEGKSSSTAGSPGYVKDINIEAPWNESGFNGWPCGYIAKSDNGKPIDNWFMDGSAAFQTNCSTSGGYGTYSFKFNYANTGASIYSWTDAEGYKGYSVRCVQDSETFNPEDLDCPMNLIMDNNWEGKIKVTISVDGNTLDQVTLNQDNPAFERQYHGKSFTIILEDLVDGNSFCEETHLILDLEKFSFLSEQYVDELKGKVVTITYNCSDSNVTITKE